jgi:hypothetical protein
LPSVGLGIYSDIPQTNHADMAYNVAAILYLLIMIHVTLFLLINIYHIIIILVITFM